MRAHLATLIDDFRRYGRQTAVVRFQGNRRRVASYGEIARLAGRFAALLVQRGIGPGDRVLLWGENSAEWIGAFHGCLLRGVLAVPLDAFGTAEFAARVAADVQPRLAVGDALLLQQLPAEGPRLTFESWPGALPAEEAGPVAGLSRATPLQILFTSGTTGDPKGVVLTHGNVLAGVEPIEQGAKPYLRWERLVHPLRFLETLPLSHVFGQMMGLWVPPIFAAEVHFESRLVASRLIETIHRERISVLAAVPRVMALLRTHLEAGHPGLAERVTAAQGIGPWRRWWRFRDVHGELGLKFWALISGGGALGGTLEQFWNTLGLVVVQGYGMTETSAIVTLNHPFHVAQGTIGKPLPGREVKLGTDGEVLVRGAMISGATWSGGALRPRTDEWLATGDLAETTPGGELRFVGRKSEVIVTAAGVNLHPDDLEAALEQDPHVRACAVVAMEKASGPEPCAVLVLRGGGRDQAAGDQAVTVIERANQRLAEFQRLRRWALWPEPDLPRTATGKVKRKAVAAWLAGMQAAEAAAAGTHEPGSTNQAGHTHRPGADGLGADGLGADGLGASADWLLKLIAAISGEAPPGAGDELRLSEDFHLDSLGRVQLEAALEERLGIAAENGLLEQAHTLGELRRLIGRPSENVRSSSLPILSSEQEQLRREQPERGPMDGARQPAGEPADKKMVERPSPEAGARAEDEPSAPQYIYPRWPWLGPVRWIRMAFLDAVVRPLVWLLAHPRVVAPEMPACNQPMLPMLIVANHVTAFDGPLVQYALPGPMRRRIAVAMAGDMLEDYRHFRNPERPPGQQGFYLPGPLVYLLLTALFNVFPLPRKRNFQRSFTHAGAALDHGYNVLVFPEGTRSAEGALASFRGGIGLLARQSDAAVLPVGLRGLGELKAGSKSWFRSGGIEVRVGQPIRFSPEETEAVIAARLHAEVKRLLGGSF